MAGRTCTRLTLLFALLVVLSASGCQHAGNASLSGPIVQIGTTKADLFGVPAEYRALHVRLEECFGRPVRFNPQPTGAAIAQQLEQGNVAFAILTAGEYASIPDTGKLTLLASATNALGKTSRKAYLVLRADSHVKTIADCAGKRFAFGRHGDLLTDIAARDALEKRGVPVDKLLVELLPPPLAFEGRLYLADDVPRTVANDVTVNAGVIDEITFSKMPATGGNLITGPSADQFRIVGETMPIPEIVVVAGPSAGSELTLKLKKFLLDEVKEDDRICQQLGVTGFTTPDRSAYEAVRGLLAGP